ncbi:MAG: hypothetical protein PUF57_08710 [Clostridiaceae bacterium]|nr:hypothetical protein [Clostridiaceae bacterium]
MKKLFSVITSIIILSVSFLPCYAANEKCSCGEAPIVYVAALGSAQIVRDKGTENERVLFRPDTAEVLKSFAPIVPAAAKLLANKDYDAFGDVLISCVNEVFGDLALDNSGNSKPNVTTAQPHPDSAEHGLDKSYYFGYDFRLDPIENAQKLHTYIQEVKALTGHDSVRFRSSSMGGVITASYIRLYGTADIETIIFQCCPLQGTAVAGELFNGKVEINKNALLRYGKQALPALDNDFLGGLLYALIDALDIAGVWDGLLGIADELVANLKDRVFDECLIPIFGTLPGIWSFVPDEYYESAKQFMRLDESTQSVLIGKLDFYHYEVQSKLETLLHSSQASGTNIYILAGYNMQRTPLVMAYKATSDGTVDTCYASCGATCSPLDEKLPDGYTQARFTDKNFLSPDGRIDASTCILPESTWFVKDMLHCKTHDGHRDFYNTLFESETQLTVFDMEEYPQFMQNDTVNQTFCAVTPEKGEPADSLDAFIRSASFYNFVKLVMTVVMNIVKL